MPASSSTLRHRPHSHHPPPPPPPPPPPQQKPHPSPSTTLPSSPFPSIALSYPEYFLLALFTLLAFATRFYRIAHPPAIVFDEFHFSKFIDRILTGTWFFDIHPPLGKLILAHISYALGYRPDPTFVIEKIGIPYPPTLKYFLIRYVSASFSVATVPLTYLIARNMRITPFGSALSTSSVLLDFLGIIEGRLILIDSQLLFFSQLSLLSALHLWRTKPNTRKRAFYLALTGLTAGAAFSIKHTALATPALIALISFFGVHYLNQPLEIPECAYAAFCGLLVYVAPFYLLLMHSTKTGGKYDKFMPKRFQATLIGAPEYDPAAKRPSFLYLFAFLNGRMLLSNANIKKRHTWESEWYQWIFNWRGVLYFVHRHEKHGVNYKAQVYLLGNPVVLYLTLSSVLIFLAVKLLRTRYPNHSSSLANALHLEWMHANGLFLLAGWLCNLLPYILVHRAAFIYHYLPGLFYGQLLMGQLFDMLPVRIGKLAVVVCIAAMAAALVYWAPWIYAMPLTDAEHLQRRWFPKWT